MYRYVVKLVSFYDHIKALCTNKVRHTGKTIDSEKWCQFYLFKGLVLVQCFSM